MSASFDGETGSCPSAALDSLFLPGLASSPFPNELESAHWNSGKGMEAG